MALCSRTSFQVGPGGPDPTEKRRRLHRSLSRTCYRVGGGCRTRGTASLHHTPLRHTRVAVPGDHTLVRRHIGSPPFVKIRVPSWFAALPASTFLSPNFLEAPSAQNGGATENNGRPTENNGCAPKNNGGPPKNIGGAAIHNGCAPNKNGVYPKNNGGPPNIIGGPTIINGCPPKKNGARSFWVVVGCLSFVVGCGRRGRRPSMGFAAMAASSKPPSHQ
jgi:hypothetical protein